MKQVHNYFYRYRANQRKLKAGTALKRKGRPPDILKFSEISSKDAKKYSSIIQNIKSAAQKCGNVRLISEQRLIHKERDDDEQTIDVISQLPQK